MKFTKKAGVIIAGAALLGTNLVALPLEVKSASALDTNYSQTNPWTTATSSNSFTITGLTEIGEKTVGSQLTELKTNDVKFLDAEGNALSDDYTVKAVLTDPYNGVVKLKDNMYDAEVDGEVSPTLDKRGTYTLYYVLYDKDGKTELAKTETLQIKVSGSSYQFDFTTKQFYTKT